MMLYYFRIVWNSCSQWLLLLVLEPYIQAGLVHLIPDPGDFNPQFGMSALRMAEQRTAGWEPNRESVGWMEALAKQIEEETDRLCRLGDAGGQTGG